MLILRSVARPLIALLALTGTMASAQSMADFFKANLPKARIAIADLPDDYKAMNLRTGSDSGLGDMFSGPMGVFMMMGGLRSGSGDNSENMMMHFIDASAISFTKGDTLDVAGSKFLITYKLAADASMIQSIVEGKAKPELELTLVRYDSVKAFVPKPDMTREIFARLLSNTPPTPSPESAKITTLSNYKQMALGLILYAGDDDDLFPYAQDSKTSLAVIQPYVKNREIMKSLNPGSEVRYNMAISGVNQTAIPAPADTVLIYESAAWPDGTRCVSFCDGHAKLVDATEWERLQGSLHLKLPHTGKPLPPNYWKQLHFDDAPGGAPVPISRPVQQATPPPLHSGLLPLK